MFKRNDAYILILGALQLFAFAKVLQSVPQILFVVKINQVLLYGFGVLTFILTLLIFGNLALLTQAFEEKNEEKQSALIAKTTRASSTALLVLLIVVFGSNIRF